MQTSLSSDSKMLVLMEIHKSDLFFNLKKKIKALEQ